MIIRIQRREDPYARIDKRPLNDDRLSYKARGILARLLTKPDDWEVMLCDLVTEKDKSTSVRAGLQELKKFGYSRLENVRDSSGRLQGKRWVIFELPEPEPRPRGFPDIEVSPMSGKSKPTNEGVLTKNEVSLRAAAGPAPLAPELFALQPPEAEFPELCPALAAHAPLVAAWRDWRAERRLRKKPLSPRAIAAQIAKLEQWGPELSTISIQTSIERGWAGLFEPDRAKNSPPARKEPITAENALKLPPKG